MAPNSDDSWLKKLMDSLQVLYSRLSTLILNRRMERYRKERSVHLDKQILTALHDIFEKTSNPENLQAGADNGGPEELVSRESNTDPKAKRSNAAAAASHSDLSSHLHSNLSKSSDSGHLGEKLKASAWDHIHTSLRTAREGKSDLAKMHAGLANEALRQASHHMTDEEYIELKTSILEELQKLRE